MYKVQSTRIGVRYPNLPTMYDLPSESPEEPGWPDRFHDLQPHLLSETCQPPDYGRDNYLMAKDLNLYYDLKHTQWYKRPDWFIVLGVELSSSQKDLRLSYVTWQEERNPFLVVELLSPGTEREDLGQTRATASSPPTKWEVYEQILKIPYYVLYDRYDNDLRVFRLQGNRYRPLDVSSGRLWLEELGLGLGLWEGSYEEARGMWLRFYDRQDNWIPTPSERAEQERQEKEQERERAERERVRAEREQERAERERVRAEGAELAAQQERQEKERERERAEREQERAERERVRAEGAEFAAQQERQEKERARVRAEGAELELQQLKERLRLLEGDRASES